VRRVELTKATEALSDYVRNVKKEPVLVLKRGRPVAAVVPMTVDEWEDYAVTHHAPLVESTRRAMERFKARGGSSLDDVMRRFDHTPGRSTRSVRRTARSTSRRVRTRR
jgi:prevent-host-death family protein